MIKLTDKTTADSTEKMIDEAVIEQELIAAIVKAVPEILIATHCVHYGMEENKVCSPCAFAGALGGWKTTMRKYRPITLEDILRALRSRLLEDVMLTVFGHEDKLWIHAIGTHRVWLLGTSLSEQSDETKLFLHSLLV